MEKKKESSPLKSYEVEAPSAGDSLLFRGFLKLCRLLPVRRFLSLPKEKLIAAALKRNQRSPRGRVPRDRGALCWRQEKIRDFPCLVVKRSDAPPAGAVLYLFGGGMIADFDRQDCILCGEIAEKTGKEVWLAEYPLCLSHTFQENIEFLLAVYRAMCVRFSPESIALLGFSSGAMLALAMITRINEARDQGEQIPMPGLLVAVSPGSFARTPAERARLAALSLQDPLIPAGFFDVLESWLWRDGPLPEQYLCAARGDFRNAPMTHFYYGSAELLYAFAPTYAAAYARESAPFVVHVGRGMFHCYPMLPGLPGCRRAHEEILSLLSFPAALKSPGAPGSPEPPAGCGR